MFFLLLQVIMTEDERWMNRAIQLARNGIYGAPPNPMVGAVIVCNGEIIGEGWHRKCGEGHAEVNAFASVRRADLLSKAKMYVTLEPCAHYGRTPPCAKLIIEKGIKEVCVGMVDPFTKVDGAGIRMMREAGIKVTVGIMQQECRKLISHFLVPQLCDRPFITLKWAQSKDGFIDAVRNGGTPVRLSTPRSLLRVHALRLQHQAIMIGTRTALLDNPRLTARLIDGPQPMRIVLDRHGNLPGSLHIFDDSAPTMVVGESDNLERAREKQYRFFKADFSKPILPAILSALKQTNIQALLVEGGATLLQHFLDGELWNEIHVEEAKLYLGTGVKAPQIAPSYMPSVEYALGSTFKHYMHPLF